jgi:hypothetical protein
VAVRAERGVRGRLGVARETVGSLPSPGDFVKLGAVLLVLVFALLVAAAAIWSGRRR